MFIFFLIMISFVYYFQNSSPTEPCPNSHQTGDTFLGGTWEGRYMGQTTGSSSASKTVSLTAGSAGYYRALTFSSNSFGAQSCPADTWKIFLYCSESSPANDAYLRFMIYTWDFNRDTIGQVIAKTATSGNYEFPTSKGYIIETIYGNAFTLSDGDKICVDLIVHARAPGQAGRTATIYYGSNSDSSKVYSPITILSSNLIEMSAFINNEGVVLQFNGRENSKGRYWKILRSEDFTSEFKILDSVFIKNSNMHCYIDRNVKAGNEYYYKIFDEFGNQFGPLKVFVSKLGYDLSIFPSNSISKDRFVLFFSSDEDGECVIKIYGKDGRLIKRLLDKRINKGMHSVVWNGKDKDNNEVPSGVYFYSYNLNNRKIIGKLIKIE